MASASTLLKQLFVRLVRRHCEETQRPLQDHLLDLAEQRFAETQRGKIVIGTSGNGRATTLQIPEDFTPLDASELVAEVLNRYDEARAALIAAGTASPTDAQICAEILDHLHPVDHYESTFSNIRCRRLGTDEEEAA